MKSPTTLSRLLIRDSYDKTNQIRTKRDLEEWRKFSKKQDIQGWEGWFLPEHDLYPKVLEHIESSDIILDVGAGNFALDILLAKKAKKVYAVEVNPIVVKDALEIIGLDIPRNLILICGNALDFPLPKDVNTVIILMRHFVHEVPESWLDAKKLILNIYGEFNVIK